VSAPHGRASGAEARFFLVLTARLKSCPSRSLAGVGLWERSSKAKPESWWKFPLRLLVLLAGRDPSTAHDVHFVGVMLRSG